MTSNRGVGRVPRRAGANPQLEKQYYQWKESHPQSGEGVTLIVFVMEHADLDFSQAWIGVFPVFPFTCLTLL